MGFSAATIGLAALSVASSAIYGLSFRLSPPSLARIVVKTLPVACLAAIATLSGGPATLTAALCFCALGDAFLALPSNRGFLPGLGTFLLGHLAYIALFLSAGGGMPALSEQTLIWIPIAILVGFATIMFAWLRSDLGPMTIPVIAYIAAIVAMGATALTLPAGLGLAMAGALLFIASDAVLATELFKMPSDSPRLAFSSAFVWIAYYAAQVSILIAFLT